jgi:hypothetical protein
MTTSACRVQLPDGQIFGPAELKMIVQWAREGRVPHDAMLLPTDGGPPRRVLDEPALAGLIAPPPAAPPIVPPVTSAPVAPPDDGVATLIPYRNPHALIGYYTSIGSLLPLLGAIAGPIAIVLGIIGLRKRKADPRKKGSVHAWIAIILGAIGTLISVGCIGLSIVGIITESQSP